MQMMYRSYTCEKFNLYLADLIERVLACAAKFAFYLSCVSQIYATVHLGMLSAYVTLRTTPDFGKKYINATQIQYKTGLHALSGYHAIHSVNTVVPATAGHHL